MSKHAPDDKDTVSDKDYKANKDQFSRVVEMIDDLEPDADRHISVQMDNSVRDAIMAAKRSGKTATVMVKIAIDTAPDRRVLFRGEVKATLPRPPTSQVTAYADEDGGIFDRDPLQVELPGVERKGRKADRDPIGSALTAGRRKAVEAPDDGSDGTH